MLENAKRHRGYSERLYTLPNSRNWAAERATILLAEHDREMRRLLATALRDQGYEVIEVYDGMGILHRLGFDRDDDVPVESVDLIVWAHRLSGTTGLEFLERLREVDWQTPVLVISAFATEDLCKEATRLGAEAVLAKPFALDDLLKRVRSLVPTS